MNDHPSNLEVISAFVDDEPFDAAELADALSRPAGREFLLDAIGVRHVVAENSGQEPVSSGRRPKVWRTFAAAAAVLLALTGGFAAGRSVQSDVAREDPPTPTRVIELRPGVEWQPISGGK